MSDFDNLKEPLRSICDGTRTDLTDAQRAAYSEACEKRRKGALPQPNPVKQVPQTLTQRTMTLAAVLADTAHRKATTGVAFISEDQILARVAICRGCDQFDQVKESCKLCGCGCNGASKLANKLAHHASACPGNPPKWLAIP